MISVLFCIRPGDTCSRAFGTTIGPECLTAVFGMGTGGATQMSSPGKTITPRKERDRHIQQYGLRAEQIPKL